MSPHGKLKLAVLISGRGSNLIAIARSCLDGVIAAELSTVISDRPGAGGIVAARELGLSTTLIDAGQYAARAQFETALDAAITDSGAQLVLLAGFMRILSAPFVQRYAGRLLNIHPSLLPRFKGLHTHRRALEAGEVEHGASVHFVTDQLDGGPVICQARVPVRPGDSEDSLAARVLREEHRIYPLVVGLIADGRLELRADSVWLDGQPLLTPIAPDLPLAGLALDTNGVAGQNGAHA
jgi:phosphoribosylglycinamide formyltransferase-1